MRTVDGLKVAFINNDDYFSSFSRETSMYGVSQYTGADVVFILAPGVVESDFSDEEIRSFVYGERHET